MIVRATSLRGWVSRPNVRRCKVYAVIDDLTALRRTGTLNGAYRCPLGNVGRRDGHENVPDNDRGRGVAVGVRNDDRGSRIVWSRNWRGNRAPWRAGRRSGRRGGWRRGRWHDSARPK